MSLAEAVHVGRLYGLAVAALVAATAFLVASIASGGVSLRVHGAVLVVLGAAVAVNLWVLATG